MKLHELKPAKGSRTKKTRVGRGISAGQGKTSGRGQKGQGSRESSSVPTGFEGGQMKMSMRLPKLRGFHNRFRREYTVVNLSKLNRFPKDSIVDGAALAAAGLVGGADKPVKLLGAGEVKVAVHVRVHRASASAQRAVIAAGGRVDLLEAPEQAVATDIPVSAGRGDTPQLASLEDIVAGDLAAGEIADASADDEDEEVGEDDGEEPQA